MRKNPRARRKPNLRGVPVGHILDTSTDNTPEPRQAWRATCEACRWTQTAGTYTDAGTLARAHADECPEAATLVEAV